MSTDRGCWAEIGGKRMQRRGMWLAIALTIGLCATACSPIDWLTYHRDNSRTGSDPNGPATPVGVAWTSQFLDQFPYTEPIVYQNRVYVATENNTVYAFDISNGGLVWSTHITSPFTQVVTPCMYDVNPVGITGTPVIDSSTNTIYVVIETGNQGHALVGLDTASGNPTVLASGDPAGAKTSTMWNRTALTLGNGRLYWGYLGADCNLYNGTMVSVKTDGTSPVFYQVPGTRGSFWGASGAAIDGDGNVWATSGSGAQTNPTAPPDRTESLIKLSPTLQELGFFTPTDWVTLNINGQDLGSAGPALLPNGLVFQAGKNKVAFLVNQATPGGVGNPVASYATNCRSFGGDAYNAGVVYMPCEDGMLALSVSNTTPPTLTKLWKGPSDSNGSPVYGGNAVWVMSVDTGNLYALNPADGTVKQSIQLVPNENARHFTTPTVAGDTVLVATAHHVVAVRHVSS